MKDIKDYTVIELIEKYKGYIETDPEKILLSYFLDPEKRQIKKTLEFNSLSNKGKIKALSNLIMRNSFMNDEDSWKINIIFKIYRNFSGKMDSKELAELKKVILGNKEFAIIKVKDDINSNIPEYEIITRENKKRIFSIKSDRTRKFVSNAFALSDIENLSAIVDSKFGEKVFSAILNNLVKQFLLENNIVSLQEFEKLYKEEKIDEVLEECKDEFADFIRIYFEDNLQYIDITKMLLSSAAVLIKEIEVAKDTEDKEVDYASIIKYLKDLNKELEKNTYKNITYPYIEYGKGIFNIDKKTIEQFLSRCTENDYVTDKEIQDIHSQILNGSLIQDIQKRKIANINLEDLVSLSGKYEEVEKEERDKILKCSLELIDYLKNEGELTEEKALELYIEGKIDLDIIKGIATSAFSEEYYNDKIKELYEKALYSIIDNKELKTLKTEEGEELRRFSKLYRELSVSKKFDVDNLIIKLITTYSEEEYSAEVMSDLYDLKLATMEKCIEWTGKDILLKQYEKGTLQPAKVQELYDEGKIKIEDIAYLIKEIKNPGERFMIIGAIFPEENERDNNIRQKLVEECINVEKENTHNSQKGKRQIVEKDKKTSKKMVTNPFARMRLFKELDEEYSFELITDGHGIIKLPNLKKIIIEKMLDKNKQPAYGAATYILEENYYYENYGSIVENRKINRTELYSNINVKSVDRIIHSIDGWGQSIKRILKIDENSNWSKEDIETIDTIIEKIKESKREK